MTSFYQIDIFFSQTTRNIVPRKKTLTLHHMIKYAHPKVITLLLSPCSSKIKTNIILYRQAAKDTSNVCNVSLSVNVTWYHRFSIWDTQRKIKKKGLKSNKRGNKTECIKNIKHWTLKAMSALKFTLQWKVFWVFFFKQRHQRQVSSTPFGSWGSKSRLQWEESESGPC